MNNTIDARGLSCPEPVILTKRVIEIEKLTRFTILVDAYVAVENISRFVKSKGYNINVSEKDNQYTLEVTK